MNDNQNLNEQRLFEHTLESGQSYKVYVPETVNENTPIYTYTMSSYNLSKNYWDNVINTIVEDGQDSIVIFETFNNVYIGQGGWQETSMEAIDQVCDIYGTNGETVIATGFSHGTSLSIRNTIELIKRNPDVPQVAACIDSFIFSRWNYDNGYPVRENDCRLSEEELKYLVDNNTLVVSYVQGDNYEYLSEEIIKSGTPVLFVVDENWVDPPVNQYYGEHNKINLNFWKTGFYNELMNFVLYNGTLPEGYIYQIYNKETDSYETINVENMNIQQLYAMYGIILDEDKLKINHLLQLSGTEIVSDNELLASYLNDIRSSINQTYMINNDVTSSFVSTTKIPTKIQEIIDNYNNSNVELLTKLTTDLHEFAKIGTIINNMDLELKNETNRVLANNDFLYNTVKNKNLINPDNIPNKSNEPIANENYLYNNVMDRDLVSENIMHTDGNKTVSVNEDLLYRNVINPNISQNENLNNQNNINYTNQNVANEDYLYSNVMDKDLVSENIMNNDGDKTVSVNEDLLYRNVINPDIPQNEKGYGPAMGIGAATILGGITGIYAQNEKPVEETSHTGTVIQDIEEKVMDIVNNKNVNYLN